MLTLNILGVNYLTIIVAWCGMGTCSSDEVVSHLVLTLDTQPVSVMTTQIWTKTMSLLIGLCHALLAAVCETISVGVMLC